MTFEDRAYRTLVVSASQKFRETMQPLLTAGHCDPICYADSIVAAKRMTRETPFDFVIINAPLPDELGARFAIDVSGGRSTVCLLFVRADLYADLRSKVTPYGVFTLSKPTASVSVTQGLSFLASARERLRAFEAKALSIEEKMEEIRLVNRAKWLLIDRLSMTEPDAHRYIEKQAMDTCLRRGDIAKEIIKTYN